MAVTNSKLRACDRSRGPAAQCRLSRVWQKMRGTLVVSTRITQDTACVATGGMMKIIKTACLLLLPLLTIATTVQAQSTAPDARVLLLGTFHFSDPGNDAVKTQSLDVTTSVSQRYLLELSNRIAGEFKPTKVLLEYSPAREDEVSNQYQAFLAGTFELPINEIYQLGFRIAKASHLTEVTSFDNQDIQWQAGAMLEYAESKDPQAYAAFEQKIAEITEDTQRDQDTLSLQQLLLKHNSVQQLDFNKALYIGTNAIGARDGYSGADAAASWWSRNFRMYANIQMSATPGERVLVLAGSGHVAIIGDFLELDPQRVAVDVTPLLRGDDSPVAERN